jgi:hypothetical protein
MRSSVAVAVLIIAGSAFGQADDEPSAPLAGPPVEAIRPDLLEAGLTMGAMPGMSMGQLRQLPMRDVRALLEQMSSDAIGEELRLSAEQGEAIKRLTREHQADVREHRKQNADWIEPLRIRGGLHPVRIPDDQLSQTQREARSELWRRLREGPNDAHLQTRVFAELTARQRAHLDVEIGRLLRERDRQRREKLYAAELNAEPVDPSTFFDAEGQVILDALPPRLRDQLAALDEPQRSNRLRRIIDRLTRVQPASPAPDGGQRPARDERAAPGIETVQVPNPED